MKRGLRLWMVIVAATALTAGIALGASTPSVTTQPATSIANTTATLHGTINPNGATTLYYFEWGTTTAYGFRSPAHSVSGTKTVKVSAAIKELTPGTAYHFRLVAGNKYGTTVGGDRRLTTTGHPPAGVLTGPPFAVGRDFAVVTGWINPEGQATTYQFQYGPTPGYGLQTFAQSLPASSTVQQVHQTIGGLAPGTTFHYRLIAAHGSSVVTYGQDATFTTFPSSRPRSVLHAHTVPRQAVNTPYIFTTTGTVGLPRSIPSNAGCSGVVAVRYFIGHHHSYALTFGKVRPDCNFTATIQFHHLVNHRSSRLRIELRFRGNNYVLPSSAAVEHVRLG